MSDLPIVRDSELNFDSDLVMTMDGSPFTGISYDESSTLGRSEIEYRNGVQEGVARDWDTSGRLKVESQYFQNTLHGLAREYGYSANLVAESSYEYGILVRRERFDGTGASIEVYELDPNSAEALLLSQYRAANDWPR